MKCFDWEVVEALVKEPTGCYVASRGAVGSRSRTAPDVGDGRVARRREWWTDEESDRWQSFRPLRVQRVYV